jgi:hypothetical protein
MGILSFIDGVASVLKQVIFLPIALWVLNRMNSKFSLLRWIKTIIVFSVAVFIFFFYKASSISPPLNTIERAAFALDVSLAHAFFTLPIISISVGAFFIVSFSLLLLSLILTSISDHYIQVGVSSESLFDLVFLGLFFFTTIKIYRLAKILLFGSAGLQTYIFGGIDPTMGLQYPATFRVTFLIDNVNLLAGNIVANPTFSKIFGFFAVVVAVVTAVKGISELIEFLLKKFTSIKA